MTRLAIYAIVLCVTTGIYCLLIAWITAGYLTTIGDRSLIVICGLVVVGFSVAGIGELIVANYKES